MDTQVEISSGREVLERILDATERNDIDALRPLGVSYLNMPLSPMRIWEEIQEAKS